MIFLLRTISLSSAFTRIICRTNIVVIRCKTCTAYIFTFTLWIADALWPIRFKDGYSLPETVNCLHCKAAGWWPHTPAGRERVAGGRDCCESVAAVTKWWDAPSSLCRGPAWPSQRFRYFLRSFFQSDNINEQHNVSNIQPVFTVLVQVKKKTKIIVKVEAERCWWKRDVHDTWWRVVKVF